MEEAEVDEPFADEAIEGRQPTDRHGPHEKAARRPGHWPGQPAQVVELTGLSGMNGRAGTEEEQGLEEGMVPDVQEAPGQTEEDPVGPAQGTTQERYSNPHDDDA